MRNPLLKRLPKELKEEFAKYFVLFSFMIVMIGFVSGFLVASKSMLVAYDESFDKYHIEDGNFELMFEANEELVERLEKEGVTIYENYYMDAETDELATTLRIFKNREEINQVCIMEGRLAEAEDEIAIDRMHADNNKIKVGDDIVVKGKKLTVTGLVALSDYSALYSSNADMMFDAVKFGVAVMTEEGFAGVGESGLHYSYSWCYEEQPNNQEQEKEMANDFMKAITDNAILTNFIPQYANQAIQFTGNDMGRDSSIIITFLYIVVLVIAFIFAITTNNTITKEATVIGTLRASGYSRGEMLMHYLTMPLLVTVISALVGNILGYTVFEDAAAAMYYASYSLPTYVTMWSMDAFIKTTIVPVILMLVINWFIIAKKLRLSPLKFIRRDLSTKQKKKALRLNSKIGIMHRFRVRIILQNMPNYITIVVGIFLANIILLFGAALPALLEHYQEDITSHMIADYQYVLKMPVETNVEGAEKYSAGSLKTIEGKRLSEQVTLMGVEENSQYVDIDCPSDKVFISSAFAEKFAIEKGEQITLQEEYGDETYTFEVEGIYDYSAGVMMFMDRAYFNEVFDYDEGYFNGYLTNQELDDIEETYITTKITQEDLTKTSRQMMHSLGGMMDLLLAFGVAMFMLIIFLLTKIIIEKNAQSISMTKILGYSNGEISRLYIMTTSLVVMIALIATLPIVDQIMAYLCEEILAQYPGWVPYFVPKSTYLEIIMLGILAYVVIAFTQYKKVKCIPMNMALKNVE